MRGSGVRNLHTRYHVMEAAGIFDENPANSTSRDQDGLSLYTGPVEYPKMLYHPKGEEKVIVPGELILSPGGREIRVGEQKELIFRVVKTKEEEEVAIEEGWHTTPARSIAAAEDPARPVPKESASQVIADKDAEIRRLQEQLAAAGLGTSSSATPSRSAKA